MAKRKRTSKRSRRLNLDRFKSYEELKAFTLAHPNEFTPQQNWAIVERMRQLRYGYKPGELRMDRTNIKIESSHLKSSERKVKSNTERKSADTALVDCKRSYRLTNCE